MWFSGYFKEEKGKVRFLIRISDVGYVGIEGEILNDYIICSYDFTYGCGNIHRGVKCSNVYNTRFT